MRTTLIICMGTLWLCVLHGQAQRHNPFSIIRSTATGADTVQQVLSQPSSSIPDTKIEGDNPFSVSHIPIRKNQYDEIRRLTPTSRVAEENISLTSLPIWLIMVSLCGLAFVIYRRKDHLTMLARSIMNENFMRMTSIEERAGFSLHYMIGYLIYLLNLALFGYLLIVKYFSKTSDLVSQPFYGGWGLYLKLLGMVALFFIIKHVSNSVMGWVFNVVKEARYYEFTLISIYNMMGVFFLFLNILLVFGPAFWIRGLAIMGATMFIIFLLSGHYRGIRIGRHQLNSYFIHFFIYFCAFEISPWVVVYTLTKDFI